MSTSDESVVDSATESTGVHNDPTAKGGGSRPTQRATRPTAGRIPMSVTEQVAQWSAYGFDPADLALLCYDELSVRLAAAWPDWASEFGQISLDDVVDELTRTRQALAARMGRHGGDEDRGTAGQAGTDWWHQWADRLTRAGWMPIGDQSPQAVALAVEAALLDCDQARKLAPRAGSTVVVSGLLKIIT